jgi:hypothetical protein
VHLCVRGEGALSQKSEDDGMLLMVAACANTYTRAAKAKDASAMYKFGAHGMSQHEDDGVFPVVD